MFDHDVKRRAFGEAEHRLARFQGFDLRHQHVFFKVDLLEALFQGELRSSERFQFPLLTRVP